MEWKMKKILNLIIFATLISLSFSAGASEKMKEPTVEYSGDMVMESDQGSMTTKLNYALGGKQRMEISAGGQNTIMILRQDKKVSWVLMPQQNTYMEMSISDASKKTGTNVNDCDMDISSQGNETVNGVSATKSKVSMSCPDNTKYDGTMWVTKEGIMVKMDAVAGQGSTQGHIKIDLKNLKIGPQEASLFEIPAGYQKFSMGDISSMIKNAQDQAAQAQAQAAREQAARDAAEKENISESTTGRAYTAQGRAYTASGSSEAANPANSVDQATDKTNETLDTTEKVKGTINKLKGLFGK
jgi:outer membrane lipoprotein-sorting protein